MKTIRLTAAQAMVRYLAAQVNEHGETYIAGMWAIFGHGNVAGIGEALYGISDELPTYRGQNEQSMAHAAIAYTKQLRRRRAMAVTSSIGPGAANMVTAAALAHVNRLPVLLIPGDVFANRGPDPVLQQLEDFGDGTMTVNDCFRPVSRYFDRIMRPEQLLTALPRAMRTMTDPADSGPVTLAFCQDVQAEAYDYPESFFEKRVWRQRRPEPDVVEFEEAVAALKAAKNPIIVAGGGVHFAGATETLKRFAETHSIPVVETQAGKSAIAWDHDLNFGPVGVTGAESANIISEKADLVFGVGTRFQDFTTGSWALFKNPNRKILALNVQPYDSAKHDAISLTADAKIGLEKLSAALGSHRFAAPDARLKAAWFEKADADTAAPGEEHVNSLPTDMQVIGAVQRQSRDNTVVMCAAGTMPGELHQLWKSKLPLSYHMEYGFSCMGYEVAGGLGIKMAEPDRDVIVMVGDGSYMMMNSELATSVAMGVKITLVITDNRGYGCINRLQMETGGAEFNNLYAHTNVNPIAIDFVAHAGSMGADSRKVSTISELEAALASARESTHTTVIVIDTDPYPTPQAGGHWWDVAVPEVSDRAEIGPARARYENHVKERQ
ncbi:MULTISPECIES: 3D-(3,5/4)-trihydroxycyclohexane-1,2-dione acylhydrolase (decyclizing) [Agrobacterium tumefaciens complex]|uniref:3D-(3,5/4)-trihydroxycyclohexane-1,2-dione acylhydrolase (Decyclizing) n=1 Tax=Agrobacterium radiobacter TaxID=362 RepID=A0ABD5LNF6_AGRRD|nr:MULTISPECIES: 3D-(3,5/4)-trihydroxycyclohexane-1,2-dione acylhydrolase (decyclizing) [Agrobacterium tumefaciens complex]KAB0457998.1 3D-(3,5/4)-trihydroxycyclohexane-1,2-dione acylhydrolase (decyclizing) [Agrobacterium tumefaciens]KWT76712.1 3D-(3,5/4)-trihydroxycyclohexane-1,2-dione acylhydrolase (decyclizing) [Agrobacterium radiobacter]NIB11867.1 3D-(3,5/4)-trihydroxycyclohexane-1,2-dione acylhydrolase (decyclizing) [Agrobacterium radiobacter]OOO31965.1 3D-(3,5/4)-trihydroxycyclohexane-1,2